MENIKETIAKLEKGLDNPYITDDIKVKISEKIAELKAELEPKPAPIPEPIAVVETKVEPTLDDLTKRLGIVNKMAAKNPALKARVKIIEKMIEKAKKGVISHKSKIKIGDIVANKKHKTIGIVRDIYGEEIRTDADGVVDIDDLEIYSPSRHNEYHIAPSTKKEITDTIGYKIVKTLGGFSDGSGDEKAILDSYSDIIPQLTRAATEPFDRVELQKLIVKITGNPDVSSDLEILRKHKVLDLGLENKKPAAEPIKELYLKQIAEKTALRKEVIQDFATANGLTNDNMLDLIQALGSKKITPIDLSTALSGTKGNAYEVNILNMLKNKPATEKLIWFTNEALGFIPTH